MTQHKFNVADATAHGVYKAILLEHLRFHQQANTGRPDLTFEGKSHAFIKPKTIEKMYPYMSYQSIQRWLLELEKDGVITSCKPFSNRGDQTKYYNVKNADLEVSDAISQNEICISQDERCISQNESSYISQNESSSILPCEEPCVGDTPQKEVFEKIEKAESKPELLNCWSAYYKAKLNRNLSLYEQQFLLHGEWREIPVPELRKRMIKAIASGWKTVVLPKDDFRNAQVQDAPQTEVIDGGVF